MEDTDKEIVGVAQICPVQTAQMCHIHYLLIHNLLKSFRPCTTISKTINDSTIASRPKTITALPVFGNCYI